MKQLSTYLSVKEDRKHEREELFMFSLTLLHCTWRYSEMNTTAGIMIELLNRIEHFNLTVLPQCIPSQTDICCV